MSAGQQIRKGLAKEADKLRGRDMSDPQSYCPFCKRTHDAPEFIEALMSGEATYYTIEQVREAQQNVVEIERLTAIVESPSAVIIQAGVWHARLDEIERLQARVDALETWVSVKDRMPEPGQRVIIFGKRSYQPKGFMRVTLIDGYGAWSGERYPEGHNEVTHWMNVPEPPK